MNDKLAASIEMLRSRIDDAIAALHKTHPRVRVQDLSIMDGTRMFVTFTERKTRRGQKTPKH